MLDSITEVEHQQLTEELETASVERCREIAQFLLNRIPVYGYAPYNSSIKSDLECEYGHPYHRHFDSHDNMLPVGCKYCRCYAFVAKGTDRVKWENLNKE
jgi:hypothetical protein